MVLLSSPWKYFILDIQDKLSQRVRGSFFVHSFGSVHVISGLMHVSDTFLKHKNFSASEYGYYKSDVRSLHKKLSYTVVSF